MDEVIRETERRVSRRREKPVPSSSVGRNVLIGRLVGRTHSGAPLVLLPLAGCDEPVAARTLVPVADEDLGRSAAVVLPDDDPRSPLVIGLLVDSVPATARTIDVTRDGARVTLTANEEIVLRCGMASITLSREGRITIRGTQLVSRATGVNRILGGSVQLN